MDEDPKTYQPRQPGRFFTAGWIIAIVAVLALTGGMVLAHGQRLENQTAELDQQLEQGPRVLVVQIQSAARERVLELPGTIHGFVETAVYAKVAGYLKTIKVDKGDTVKAGQLLAIIESPELDHQVVNARVTYDLALITDRRNQNLLRANVVARQVADDSRGRLLESKATLAQLIAMQGYERIRAPFDGVVTARYVDPGALIPQSTAPSAANIPLLALATLSPLRVYADAPQSVAPFIQVGDPATVAVTEYPGRTFAGQVTRHPAALTAATRTMLVEVDLANDDRALLPGMYAKVTFQATAPVGPALVPDDALIFRNGKPFVPVVRDKRLKLTPVVLGYDNGIEVEVTGGVAPADFVAINVGQAARDGETVRPITSAPSS